MIISPVSGSDNCILERTYQCELIIKNYWEIYKIDISSYFEGIEEVELYNCLDTGYHFFYPFTIAGNSFFYEQLQNFDWYYMPWKWEHQVTARLLKKNDKVLEVGCGSGAFVRKFQNEGFDITGLELNEDSVKTAKIDGLRILNETVEAHASNNAEIYDIVCSFQVLEHISDVSSFLFSSIKCLKPGGRLIICVPDNDSFIKRDIINILNMPPHHMGLWNTKSLRMLKNYFPLSVSKTLREPLQKYHVHWYVSLMERQICNFRIPKYIFYKFKLNKIILLVVKIIAPVLNGHSIMAQYIKI